MLLLLLLLLLPAAQAAASLPARVKPGRRRLATTSVTTAPGFASTLLFANLAHPMALSFHPADGRVLIALKGGSVLIGGGAANAPLTTLLKLPAASVSMVGDGGFANAILDPFDAGHNFAFLYCAYLVPGPTGPGKGDHSRVSRFALNAARTAADPASEQVLFEHTALAGGTAIHFGGGLAFGADGFLYSTHGSRVATDSQLLSTTSGKLVRFARNGTVPTSNPFFSAALPAGAAQNAVFALGLRNPFILSSSRIAPGAAPLPDGASPGLTIGDVGEHTWEEINVPVAGSNFGWPAIEGGGDGAALTPGAAGKYVDPAFAYKHNQVIATGLGGGCSITGVVRPYDASAATIARGSAFPPAFQGATFLSDLCGGWIGYVGGRGGLAPGRLVGGLGKPIALSLNEVDGALYVLADPESAAGSLWTVRALLPPGGNGVGPAAAMPSVGASPPPPAPSPAAAKTQITVQPVPAFTGFVGTQTTFFVGVASTTMVTFLWQKAAAGSAAFGNIAGANASSYLTAPLTFAMQGRKYRCLVTPLGGAVLTSGVATIVVATFKPPTMTVAVSVDGASAGTYSSSTPTTKTLPCPQAAGTSYPKTCNSVSSPALAFSGGTAFSFAASGTDFSGAAAGAPLRASQLSFGVTLFHEQHTHQMSFVDGKALAFSPPQVGEYDPVQSYGITLTATTGGAVSTLFLRIPPVLGSITLAPTAAAAAQVSSMSVLINGAPTPLPVTFTTVAGMQVDLSTAGSCAAWADGDGDRTIAVPPASLNSSLHFTCVALPRSSVPPSSAAASLDGEIEEETPQQPGDAQPDDSATSSPAASPEPTAARATGGAAQAQSAASAIITLLAGAAAMAAF